MPADKVRAKRKADPNPGFLIQCPRCGGREITPTLLGATMKGGKVTGGTKAYVCVCCLLKGERVALG